MATPETEYRVLAARLADLPDDAFEEKFAISTQMDELRDSLPTFHKDAGRSRAALETELRERRKQLAAILHASGSATTPMSDGAGGAGDAAHGNLRSDVHAGMGLDEIDVRIGELNAALERLNQADG